MKEKGSNLLKTNIINNSHKISEAAQLPKCQLQRLSTQIQQSSNELMATPIIGPPKNADVEGSSPTASIQ